MKIDCSSKSSCQALHNAQIFGMSTVEQIESKIASLLRKIQMQVVERLNARLWPSGFAPAVEEAWADTVKRRVDEMDTGKVDGIPAARVFARSRRLLSGK